MQIFFNVLADTGRGASGVGVLFSGIGALVEVMLVRIIRFLCMRTQLGVFDQFSSNDMPPLFVSGTWVVCTK